jgi:hypothetical protein
VARSAGVVVHDRKSLRRSGPTTLSAPPAQPPLLARRGNVSDSRFAIAFLTFLLLTLPAFAADLRLAAASDLNFAIKEIISQYEKDTGNHVQLTLGSSGTFFTQISEGAPFDVYLSADRSYPDQLLDRKLGEPGTLFIYGVGRIVVWVPASSPIDVTKLGMRLFFILRFERFPSPIRISAIWSIRGVGHAESRSLRPCEG